MIQTDLHLTHYLLGPGESFRNVSVRSYSVPDGHCKEGGEEAAAGEGKLLSGSDRIKV